jgi:hypothetical protein
VCDKVINLIQHHVVSVIETLEFFAVCFPLKITTKTCLHHLVFHVAGIYLLCAEVLELLFSHEQHYRGVNILRRVTAVPVLFECRSKMSHH